MLLTISYKPFRGEAKMSIPDLFKCPISLDLFTDPVTLCTGQTYDRPCIEKWISSGNLTCPVTMLTLHDLSMVPNRTLSHLIRQWLDQNAQRPPDHPHDQYLVTLKQTLESQEPIWEKKLQALKQLKLLSLELPIRGNEDLNQFGFLQLLLELGFQKESNYTHQILELVELALATALNLIPFGDLRCLNVLKEEPKFESLLALLEQGTPLIKITLCCLLEAALSSQHAKELSFLIRNSGDIQRSIINLIHLNDKSNDSDGEVSEAAVKFMLAICMNCIDHNIHKSTLEKLVQLGGVKSLIRYISSSLNKERGLGLGAATKAIEVLLEVEGGKEALIGEKNGVKALVKMVFRVCDHQGCESAVNSLMGLCCESSEVREEAVKVGVLTQLLLLLQSQCSGRAKAKARMLLKLLRVMWTKDPLATCL